MSVAQVGNFACLNEKVFAGLARQVVVQDFDGGLRTQMSVFAQIHLRKPTSSQQLYEAIIP